MAAHRRTATERECCDPRPVGDVLGSDEPGQRPAAFARDRQVEQQPPVPRQQIALPSEPNDGVAAAHQVTVAGVRQGARVVGRGRVIEELQHSLVAAVAVIEKETAVAESRIDRLQDREIAGEMDEPLAISWRLIEIGDAALSGGGRVDREMGAARKPFVSADRAEFAALGKHKALGDGQFHSIAHQTRLQRAGPVNITRTLASRIYATHNFQLHRLLPVVKSAANLQREFPNRLQSTLTPWPTLLL